MKLRKLLALLSALLLFCSVLPLGSLSVAAAPYEILTNGDFEDGSANGWKVFQNSAVNTDAKYTGNYGLQLNGNGMGGNMASQKALVQVGKTYVVRMRVKTLANGANIQISDGAGKKLAVDWFDKTEWTYLSYTVTPTNKYLEVRFFSTTTTQAESLYVDDISVIALSENGFITHHGASIRDTADDQRGLAFRFRMNVIDAKNVNNNKLVSGAGVVSLLQDDSNRGVLIEAGAIVTNVAPKTPLLLSHVDGKKTVNVQAKNLLECTVNSIDFAVRVIRIPDHGADAAIYVRPYYVCEFNGERVTVYGDTVSENYNNILATRRTRQVLTIGSEGTYGEIQTHLYDVLKAAAYDLVVLGNLSLDKGHNAAIQADTASFTYHKNDNNGKWVTTKNVAASAALKDEAWEFVVIDLPADEMDTLPAILQWVRDNVADDVKILLKSTDSGMVGNVDAIIPSATALGNLETALPADQITDSRRDYTATLAWYQALTDEPLSLIATYPADIGAVLFSLNRCAILAEMYPAQVQDLSETVLLAGGDYQPRVWAGGPKLVNELIASAQKNGPTMFDGFFAVGDYASQSGHDVSTQGIGYLDEIVSKVTYGNKVYVEGNHDAPTVEMLSPSGNNDPVGGTYGVFVIHEEEYGAYGNGGGETVARKLTAYFNQKLGDKNWGNKPIFVLTHVPLHYSRRTVDESCAKTAGPMVRALNEAGKAGLNIIVLFGHNHSSAYDDFLGGASIYLKKGDAIPVCAPGQEGHKMAPTMETIHFTYMNAGYINNYADHGSGADLALTMTTFRIRQDGAVIITRYDKNGEHNLKSEGKLNYLDNPEMVTANTTVYESSRIVTADDDQPYTE